MVRLVIALSLVAVLSQPAPPGSAPPLELPVIVALPTPEFKFPRNGDSIVMVRQQPKDENSGGCTAFAVRAGKQNVYLTAQHCIDNPPVRIGDQPGTVVLADSEHDLAAISIPLPPKNALKLGSEPNPTEMAVAIGFVGGTPSFIVTRKIAQEGPKVIWGPKFLPGMSGGPILNRQGEVVGIVQNVGNPTSVFDGIAISSGAEQLKQFVKRVEAALSTPGR